MKNPVERTAREFSRGTPTLGNYIFAGFFVGFVLVWILCATLLLLTIVILTLPYSLIAAGIVSACTWLGWYTWYTKYKESEV